MGRLNQLAFSHNLSLQHPLIVDSTIAIAELVSRGMGIAFYQNILSRII